MDPGVIKYWDPSEPQRPSLAFKKFRKSKVYEMTFLYRLANLRPLNYNQNHDL